MHLVNSPEINIYKWINFFDTVFTGNVQHTHVHAWTSEYHIVSSRT